MHSTTWRRLTTVAAIFGAIVWGPAANAQIGGQTAADGPFILEDVEDLDLEADSLGRDWIPDFSGGTPILEATGLSGSGLTPAPGQSPSGIFRIDIAQSFGSISGSFGVPMPGEVGASTDPAIGVPGNVVSFDFLTFVAVSQSDFTDRDSFKFQVLLECYPQNDDGSFPTVFWNYSPAVGSAFESVALDLKSPDSILNNPDNLSVETLLSSTRFLAFFAFVSPTEGGETLTYHVDDITLTGVVENSAANWSGYE